MPGAKWEDLLRGYVKSRGDATKRKYKGSIIKNLNYAVCKVINNCYDYNATIVVAKLEQLNPLLSKNDNFYVSN